jgi:hypothetical protein
MTVTLNLKPDVEAGLLAQAQASGLTLEAFAEEVLREKSREVHQGSHETIASGERPIWEIITDRMKNIPAEVFEHLPEDGASEHDHYLYGSPKRNQ